MKREHLLVHKICQLHLNSLSTPSSALVTLPVPLPAPHSPLPAPRSLSHSAVCLQLLVLRHLDAVSLLRVSCVCSQLRDIASAPLPSPTPHSPLPAPSPLGRVSTAAGVASPRRRLPAACLLRLLTAA